MKFDPVSIKISVFKKMALAKNLSRIDNKIVRKLQSWTDSVTGALHLKPDPRAYGPYRFDSGGEDVYNSYHIF
jgi:hypothetical protein